MSAVPGDPASLSSCAATTGSLAPTLAARAEALTAAIEDLGVGWPGRRSVGIRRRGAAVAEGLRATAGELERVSRVLQDQATDLAGLRARARALEERAATAGLEVRDGRVLPALGLLSAADASAEGHRDETAASLQAELDLVLAQHRRRRDFVLGVLRASTSGLAEVSAALRR